LNTYNEHLNSEEYTFDEWVDFVFAHLSNQEFQDKWFEEEGVLIRVGNRFAENCIELFKKPKILLEKYNGEQIEQGFEFILSPGVLITSWLWDKNNNPQIRREFISSMENVFNEIFVVNKFENLCFMWWDYLRGFDDDKDLQVMEWMFETLSGILKIDSIDCQMSALHGLGHIEHRGKKNLIEVFLRKNSNFTDKDYALAAIEGKVL